MATADLNLPLVLEERFLKISASSQPRAPQPQPGNLPEGSYWALDRAVVPWLRLSGRWLEKAGFAVDGKVRIQVELGRLVITPA